MSTEHFATTNFVMYKEASLLTIVSHQVCFLQPKQTRWEKGLTEQEAH